MSQLARFHRAHHPGFPRGRELTRPRFYGAGVDRLHFCGVKRAETMAMA